MKLYSIRDKLLGYFIAPFASHSDNDVLASCARAINQEDNRDPIAQTPSHFELWQLAEINEETGKVTGDPVFLTNCSDLVRSRVRKADGPGAAETAAAATGGAVAPGHAPQGTPAAGGAVRGAVAPNGGAPRTQD